MQFNNIGKAKDLLKLSKKLTEAKFTVKTLNLEGFLQDMLPKTPNENEFLLQFHNCIIRTINYIQDLTYSYMF